MQVAKGYSENENAKEVERVISLHRPYNITSHFHSWCNGLPVVSIGGIADC